MSARSLSLFRPVSFFASHTASPFLLRRILQGEQFESCAPSVTCALRAALECSAAAAVAAVETPLPAALARRIQRATKTILGHRSSADERDASRAILIRCLNVLQSFLSHAVGDACGELPMRALAEALTGVWPLADRDTGIMFALLSAMANCALGSPHFGREFLLHCRCALVLVLALARRAGCTPLFPSSPSSATVLTPPVLLFARHNCCLLLSRDAGGPARPRA